jgi:SAM-dependent methyltransferase
MSADPITNKVRDYFADKFRTYGTTPQGVDWNSEGSQEGRFKQLCTVIEDRQHVSILDYGCGYGALYDYLELQGYQIDQYVGFDIVEAMIKEAKHLHTTPKNIIFTTQTQSIPMVDYCIASGAFNNKLETPNEAWLQHVLENLEKINQLTRKGFSANFLTSYSDTERMAARPDLFFADPCFLFDYCQKHFSRWTAVLHDYRIYDFTIIVRKDQN